MDVFKGRGKGRLGPSPSRIGKQAAEIFTAVCDSVWVKKVHGEQTAPKHTLTRRGALTPEQGGKRVKNKK